MGVIHVKIKYILFVFKFLLDKRSAHLSQFIIHRGLIISFIQAVFSALFYFVAIPIYTVNLFLNFFFHY